MITAQTQICSSFSFANSTGDDAASTALSLAVTALPATLSFAQVCSLSQLIPLSLNPSFSSPLPLSLSLFLPPSSGALQNKSATNAASDKWRVVFQCHIAFSCCFLFVSIFYLHSLLCLLLLLSLLLPCNRNFPYELLKHTSVQNYWMRKKIKCSSASSFKLKCCTHTHRGTHHTYTYTYIHSASWHIYIVVVNFMAESEKRKQEKSKKHEWNECEKGGDHVKK